MRNLFVPLLTLSFLVSPGCNSKKAVAQDTAVFGSDADPVFFSLERTPCFGKCPAYVITIQRDGSATYVGRSNAEREGTYTGKVDEATMVKLLDKANEIGFFDMQDKYDGQVTDLPSTIIRVNANGKDKKVIGRYRTPSSFKPFAAYADSLLVPVQWTKVNDEK
jgi:hypothetical protein